jgi:hypothetical protein
MAEMDNLALPKARLALLLEHFARQARQQQQQPAT